jgi:hypothetical protein
MVGTVIPKTTFSQRESVIPKTPRFHQRGEGSRALCVKLPHSQEVFLRVSVVKDLEIQRSRLVASYLNPFTTYASDSTCE